MLTATSCTWNPLVCKLHVQTSQPCRVLSPHCHLSTGTYRKGTIPLSTWSEIVNNLNYFLVFIHILIYKCNYRKICIEPGQQISQCHHESLNKAIFFLSTWIFKLPLQYLKNLWKKKAIKVLTCDVADIETVNLTHGCKVYFHIELTINPICV